MPSWTKTYAGAEPQRVNKWLAAEGVCSRREAEALIADGLVSIDGAQVEDPGRKIEPGQTLTLGESNKRAALTAVLNKPVGFVSAQPEAGQTPAARLVTRANLIGAYQEAGALGKISFAPLGRLDQDSRGLLLLSEDGVLARAVIGAESAIDKEYLVRVEGRVTDAKLKLLRHGLRIDRRVLKPAKIVLVEPQLIRFTLTEGMKRQIRRMCSAVELEVVDLQRTRIGPLQLATLPEGKWRPLAVTEREALLKASKP